MGLNISSVSPAIDCRESFWSEARYSLNDDYSTYTLAKKPRNGTKFIFITVDKQTETYTIVKRIGESNAKVDLCKNNKDEFVAIKTNKIVLHKDVKPDEVCSYILENVELIRSQSLEHFTEVQNSYYFPKSPDKQYVYTIMTYYEHGDLLNYIQNNIDYVIPEETVLKTLKQVSHALANLHFQDIVHRDIKV